jgi:hypothetical protein
MKTLILIVCTTFCFILAGCSTICTPTNIAVPVLVDLPDFPARPELQIKMLKEGDTADKALAAAGADINMLLGREAQWKEFLLKYKAH